MAVGLGNWHLPQLVDPKCDQCGDIDGVYIKQIAYFDIKQHAWVVEHHATEVHCSHCGNESVDLTKQMKNKKVIQ
jgi:ribosomal protein S27E